ncbi:radial spoke head 10 homolog B-like isoform X2 [Tenebrio molitor]|uniref:radial spoke head 10 homolog B-like isoform X2 n=1 Tax=Tenebrio molitor TaxID=7067 RepID=UPI0036249992
MSSTRRSSAERDKSKDSVAPASIKSVESPDVESPDVDALHFPQIKRMDDVITNFFNQIVQYVIEDLIIVEPKEEPVVEVSDEGLVKDYKDLKAEDLVNAEVTATSGSKVVLSRKSSSKSLSRKKGSSARNVEKKAESGSLGRKVESSLRNVDKKTESSLRNVDKKTESSLRNVDKKTESSLRNVDRKTESSLRNVDKKTVSSLRNVDRRSESSVDKKLGKSMNASFTLETIKEEMSEASRSKTSTASSSLQDPLMEEEREVKIIFTNGNTYEGRISKRIMNGKGRYVWTDGTVYEGDFKDGFPTGKGTMVLPDLSRYEGEFNQGLFHGHGFLNIVATPTFYSGRWRNGLKHGEGWLLYEPGDWYEGGWANDFKDGFGLRCYKNGAKYRGEWREGKYDGRGMMIWENSDYYKGEWSKGAMHGKGEYIWKAFYNTTFAFPVQTIYRGEWAEGKRSGEGTMYFGDESGLKLKGKWDDDFKHGDGLLVCGNGRVVEQTLLFQYDKPTRTESSASSVPHNLLRQILDVPVFNAPEFVDVGFYVDKLLSKLQDVSDDKLKLLKTFEEKCIKNTIIRFLPQLKDLYRDYCSMAAKAQLHYEPVLIRLFLWQLYQDIDISRSGISLAGTDLILGENPNSCVENVHCPFEPIYFWQFLMSLVGVALSTISLEEIYDTSSSQGGVSSFVVKKFFDEVLFAKPSDHRDTLLLNYLDLAPIKAVYALYQKVGEPHSARTFLQNSCTRKGELPLLCHLEMHLRPADSQFGANFVPLAQYITFDVHKPVEMDEWAKHRWATLFDLRHLGAKNIVRCLAKVCPLIVQEDRIVNMDYPLTFLEFYQTVLTCIFTVLELEMKKEHKILWQSVPTPVTETSASSKPRTPLKKVPSQNVVKVEKKAAKKKKKKKKHA